MTRPRRDWARGFGALKKLMNDPDSTQHAFDLVEAVEPERDLAMLKRLRKSAEGRQLLADRPRLIDWLSDRESLARLPDGSFGRAYLAFIEKHALDPGGLIELRSRDPHPRWRDPERAWLRDHTLLLHDLWHVLTGYDADSIGEAKLLPFSLAQIGGAANWMLTTGAFFRAPKTGRWWIQRRMWESFVRGRRATWLPALRYDELLSKPLAEVRELAAIR